MQPFVSVLMPTYNRRQFITTIIEVYKNQTYPKTRMEWVILDDGSDKVQDLFEKASKTIPNIRYMYEPNKMTIGAKRNRLISEAKGEIIVWMDDDDYYPAKRVSDAVTTFANNKSINILGSSQLYLYYTDTKKICTVGPFSSSHGTNGTIAIRTAFAKKRKYDETVAFAEEAAYFDNFSLPMVQLNPMKTMLVICHNANTYDKKIIRGDYLPEKDKHQRNPSFKETSYKLRDFVKEQHIRDFYNSLSK